MVLGLLVTFNVEAASYLFKDNLYTDCNILTKKDPTAFQNISFVKEKKIKWWDRRKATSSGWKENSFKVFIFKATFEKGRTINIRVNAEFETKDKSEEQLLEEVARKGLITRLKSMDRNLSANQSISNNIQDNEYLKSKTGIDGLALLKNRKSDDKRGF